MPRVSGQSFVVYFIEAPSVGLIKIGTTRDVRSRFRGLLHQSPVPVRLLGVLPIADGFQRWRDVEVGLHRRFLPLHSHGEWFRAVEPLTTFIATAGLQQVDTTIRRPDRHRRVGYRTIVAGEAA